MGDIDAANKKIYRSPLYIGIFKRSAAKPSIGFFSQGVILFNQRNILRSLLILFSRSDTSGFNKKALGSLHTYLQNIVVASFKATEL